MTPHEFLTKWRAAELKERSASQAHFMDLCRLLGVEDPIAADPKGDWFTFEKGATKTSGGEGWADVWRKGCFAWEYKGRAANLDKAYDQLLRYSIALESPPLLIVSDMDRIRIHTNWTNTVQQVREIALEDLADAATRDILRACFEEPEALRPAKTRQILTEEAAREFAALAQRLRWEAASGYLVTDIPGISKPVVRAIERTGCGVEKGSRPIMLLRAGLDVLYILTGHRQLSPSERSLVEYVRTVGNPAKFNLLDGPPARPRPASARRG